MDLSLSPIDPNEPAPAPDRKSLLRAILAKVGGAVKSVGSTAQEVLHLPTNHDEFVSDLQTGLSRMPAAFASSFELPNTGATGIGILGAGIHGLARAKMQEAERARYGREEDRADAKLGIEEQNIFKSFKEVPERQIKLYQRLKENGMTDEEIEKTPLRDAIGATQTVLPVSKRKLWLTPKPDALERALILQNSPQNQDKQAREKQASDLAQKKYEDAKAKTQVEELQRGIDREQKLLSVLTTDPETKRPYSANQSSEQVLSHLQAIESMASKLHELRPDLPSMTIHEEHSAYQKLMDAVGFNPGAGKRSIVPVVSSDTAHAPPANKYPFLNDADIQKLKQDHGADWEKSAAAVNAYRSRKK